MSRIGEFSVLIINDSESFSIGLTKQSFPLQIIVTEAKVPLNIQLRG